MRVSIIIPTYNEEKVIGECLQSLAKQSLKDMEIIVVDDDSTDETLKTVRSLITDYRLPTTVLQQQHLGPGAARNLGARQARGEILVFVDADMSFDKDFIKKLIEPILKAEVKGTFSKEEYVSNWDNVWARCWNINQGWLAKQRHVPNYPNEQKVFRAILRKEFDRIGGFEQGGYTDDWSLSEKLGYLAKAAEGARFYHQNPDNLGEVFKQAKWVAKREYKLGILGSFGALLRSSLLVSLIIGFWKSLIYKQPSFLIFKVVYDFGILIGIFEYLIFKKAAK